MRSFVHALFALLAGMMGPVFSAQQAILVDKGICRAVIVRAEDAAPGVEVACNELRDHLRLVSGVALPLLKVGAGTGGLRELTGGRLPILVGPSRFTRELGIDEKAIPAEGFVLRISADSVAVVGHDGPGFGMNYRFMTDSAGTLYGAYHLRRMKRGDQGGAETAPSSKPVGSLDGGP